MIGDPASKVSPCKTARIRRWTGISIAGGQVIGEEIPRDPVTTNKNSGQKRETDVEALPFSGIALPPCFLCHEKAINLPLPFVGFL